MEKSAILDSLFEEQVRGIQIRLGDLSCCTYKEISWEYVKHVKQKQLQQTKYARKQDGLK